MKEYIILQHEKLSNTFTAFEVVFDELKKWNRMFHHKLSFNELWEAEQ